MYDSEFAAKKVTFTFKEIRLRVLLVTKSDEEAKEQQFLWTLISLENFLSSKRIIWLNFDKKFLSY